MPTLTLGFVSLCALTLSFPQLASASPSPSVSPSVRTSTTPRLSGAASSSTPSASRPPADPNANRNTIWWRLCDFGAPENYAVQAFSYHQGFGRIIHYCGHNEKPRKARFGVRHFESHTHEYQFAVDLTSRYIRGLAAPEDWQEITTGSVLVNPTVETGAGIEGNCASRRVNLVMVNSLTGQSTLLDSRVYRVGWWDANGVLPERTATAFIPADGTHCDKTLMPRAATPQGAGQPDGVVTCGLEGRGCATHEGPVSIYKSERTIAAEIRGAIRDRYAALGWENGPNHYPTSNEFCGLRDSGCGQRYEDGLIYWSAATGAWSVHGAIGGKYANMGWETGRFGYPIGNEFCGLVRGGCGQHFQREQGSLYWSPATGVHATQGLIKQRWADLGWERGELGYPTSDEYVQDGVIHQTFEGGWLAWGGGDVYGAPWGSGTTRYGRASDEQVAKSRTLVKRP